jgi:hypothetical protein
MALFIAGLLCFTQAHRKENPIRLKQINAAKTNFKLKKWRNEINKTPVSKEGKNHQIKTSDVVQFFFYNPRILI